MKKLLILLAAVALVAWVISWFWADEAVATSAAQPWPGGKGELEAVFERFPPLKANEASRQLTALASGLPRSEAVDGFVRREIEKAVLTIGAPPPLSDVTAIRELLLREPIVWESRRAFDDAGIQTRRALQMTMARALVANALAKARANDRAAWDDLHAAWKLARTLDGHPQMMVHTASLSMARMINGLSWKMPLPAPAWLAEVQQRDHVEPLIEAFQYQSASYWKSGTEIFPTKVLARSIDHDRAIAEELLKVTHCDVNTRMNELGTDLRSVWRRAFRYRAEREASANALRVREGKPVETKSVCSDGGWTFDGTTLRFSRDIPLTGAEQSMPLALQVKP